MRATVELAARRKATRMAVGGTVGRRATLADELLRLARSHGEPIGAYQLAAQLTAQSGKRSNIYKSLNTLVLRGDIIRIASLRRYWAWPEGLPRPALLLACGRCNRVEVADAREVSQGLDRIAAAHLFDARAVELPGRCRDCSPPQARSSGSEGDVR